MCKHHPPQSDTVEETSHTTLSDGEPESPLTFDISFIIQ